MQLAEQNKSKQDKPVAHISQLLIAQQQRLPVQVMLSLIKGIKQKSD